MKIYPPIQPPPLFKGISGIDPKIIDKRGYELEGTVSVRWSDVFQDLPKPIYSDFGIAAIRKAAEEVLEKVDMSMIKPEDTVNILGAHHGFTILGGHAYAEMLRTIKDVVEKRTGCRNIRLRIGVGNRWREGEEYIKHFKLDEYFGPGKATGIAPVDEGIPIETELGVLYGLKKAYDSDWIIVAHNNDIRELYFHREIDRALKPFAMAFARIETRSAYHTGFILRSANLIGRVIYESPFVQKKWAFACYLTIAPTGIVDVVANNDMIALSRYIDIFNLKYYGKIVKLYGEIPECITVFDQSTATSYALAGGISFCTFYNAHIDLFDLDVPTGTSITRYGFEELAAPFGIGTHNPAIKAFVINYMWAGLKGLTALTKTYPTIVVKREQADLYKLDTQTRGAMDYAVIADNLDQAMNFAYKIAKTRNVIIFDGTLGGVNVSEPLAKLFFEKASDVSEKVEKTLLPKWLKQRGIDL